MNRGYSLVELAIVVGVSAIVVGAVVVFVGRGFGISRTNFEQARITEDARNLAERISDIVRNARDVRVQLPYEIVVLSNVDADPEIERLRFTLQQTTLYRGVIQPVGGIYSASQEQVTPVAKSVRNFEQRVPLFTYYLTGQGTLSVGITLMVDANLFEYPPYAVINTLVTPRRLQTSAQPTSSPLPTPTPSPGPIPQCSNNLDDDGDGYRDYPADVGCGDATDNDETNPFPGPECGDILDNDGDTLADYPDDLGCESAGDPTEFNGPTPQCGNLFDDDSDFLTDFPSDLECSSQIDDDEANGPACNDNTDNDGDTLTDYPADPECVGPGDPDEAN